MSREAEERLTVAAFVAELQANLRSAEKELDAFFRDPAARAGLPEAQKALAQVSGALALLGHDNAHRAVDHARGTIARFVEHDGALDQGVFETLAQSLGAVGFYVDQIKHDRIDPAAFAFDAETGRFSAAIGRPATSAAPTDASDDMTATVIDAAHDGFPAVEAPEAPTDLTYSEIAFAATQVLDSEQTLEQEIAHRAADARDHAMRLRADPADRALRDQLAAAVDDVRRNAALIDDRSLQDEAATVLGSLRRAAQAPLGAAAVAEIADAVVALAARADRSVGIAPPSVAPAEPVVAVPSADNLEAVDAELLGIFLEEGGGVLQDATDSMRVLDADPQNATATINLRRGFHTLKGSSRMVGLMSFGEAAWAIEDTLNGHIADQVPASSDLRALIDYAIRYLSGWIAELHEHGGSSRVPDALVEAARAVRAGQAPPAMAAAPISVREVQPTFAATEIVEPEPTFTATEVVEPEPMFAATEIAEPELTFATTEIIEPAPAPEEDEPLLEEDTLFTPTHGEIADPAYAATEVIGPDQEAELRFFGEQPRHPAADATASTTSGADEASPTTDAVDETPVAGTDETIEVVAMPADETGSSLDWLDIPEVAANDATVDEPVTLENPADEALHEAEAAEVTAAAPERSDNVVAFVPRDMVPAGDELRRIGSLTLSVALFNIYLTEADELLRVLTQDLAEWKHELDRVVSDSAVRAVHSLSGSSATVGLAPAHDLASAIEEVLVSLYRDPVPLTTQHVDVMQDAVESLRRMLHRFAAERMPEPDPVRIAALIALQREFAAPTVASTPAEVTPAPVEAAPTPVEAAPTELSFEALDFGDEPIASVPAAPTHDEPVALDESVDLAPLEDDAAEVSSEAFGDVEDFETAAPIDATTMPDAPSSANDESAEFEFEPLAPNEEAPVLEAPVPVDDMPVADEPVDEPVTAFKEEPVDEPVATLEEEPVDEPVAALEDDPVVHVDVASAMAELEAAPQARRVVPSERETAVTDDLDPDLLDVFVEEGNEVLPQIGELLRTWQSHRDNAAPSRLLLRHLHTLKGSARMAGAMRLGEVVHDMEARVESAARLSDVPMPLMDELVAAHDRSLELFDELQRPPVEAVAEVSAQAPAEAATVETAAQAAPLVETLAPVTAAPRARDQKQSPQHVVRVGSETLDRLVNLAGEVSISRARIENEVVQLKGAMADLSDNVERLRAQLREIELQAEFQMQSQMQSQQAAGAEREKFDPLEFDRFTRFQELTRMMAESVNDVKTVQQHLQKSLDSAEVDLTSQRRMTRDLQQDLMQRSHGAVLEHRRTALSRRAAVREGSRQAGQPRHPRRLGRNRPQRAGADGRAVRTPAAQPHRPRHRDARRASRDGQGRDRRAARRGAAGRQRDRDDVLGRRRGSRSRPHPREGPRARTDRRRADISDAQAAELIFHPGFSTATEVTELAGRGVGMDVVRAEAMELAGRVAVDSERRPRHALHDHAAVDARGHAGRAGVGRQPRLCDAGGAGRAGPSAASATARRRLSGRRARPCGWRGAAGVPRDAARPRGRGAGRAADVAGADPALGRRSHRDPRRRGRRQPGSRRQESRAAAGADDRHRRRDGARLRRDRADPEPGPAVAGDPCRSGARRRAAVGAVEPTRRRRSRRKLGATLQTLPTVMVVDDSLTVRRVTQRLLSREGYQVVLAKDGVDALEQLQDYVPDVMLVDIEMPRMDGFDLTRNVRNDERYRRIPIIMITSRTAEKHRRHAAELGVDAYLGKPYQEDELLELLTMHVEAKRGQTA